MIVPKAELTASGRPRLAAGEIERALLDKVDIEFEGGARVDGEEAAPRYEGGYAIVTSHRVIWIDAAAAPRPGRSCALPVGSLHAASKRIQYGLNIMAPKVRVELRVYVDADSRPCGAPESFRYASLSLRCRGPAPDAFVDTVAAALAAARRAAAAAPPPPGGSVAGPRPPAGGGGDDGWGSAAPADGGWGAAPPAGAAGGGGGAPPAASASLVDASYLTAIIDMGFPRNRAVRALVATRNDGVQQAIDWMLAYGDAPGLDDPLDDERPGGLQPPAAAATAAAQGTLQQQGRGPPGGGGLSQGAAAMAAAGGGGGIGEARRQWHQQQGAGGTPPPSSQQWPPPMAPAAYPGLAGAGPSASATGLSAAFTNPLLWGGAQPAGPSFSGPEGGGGGGGLLRAGGAGVAGLMAREQSKAAVAGAALGAAFSDLRALMDAAQEMVALAERFGAQQAGGGGEGGNASGGASGGGGGEDAALDRETQAALAAMGIVSPVTRASAGGQYLQQLARQLADFLEGPLGKAGGLMMLPDVYCLFNRARGTELVSPDDLLAAAEQLEPLGLPLRLRRFSSGVIVVQGAQHSDAALCARIAALLPPPGGSGSSGSGGLGGPLSASAVGVALGLPVALAREALVVAEAAGALCRDDGPEGLRFFRNFFGDAGAGAAVAALLAA
ncbi:MAG: EAP30/Vps36 family-domain-containing protein [Monoraphidium minutum]|nr:MAG: EAP30/Vps36 family-domain-containing protein [Monoraphidium minutum]